MKIQSVRYGIWFILFFFMIIIKMPVTFANEADYEWTNNRDGTVTIRDYIGTDTAITIPSQVNGRLVTAIGSGAFGEKGLTEVVIPDSVTSIGDVAFAENQLTYVKLPNNLTKIGEGVFFTNKLTTIEIPDQVTQIGTYAFLDNKLATIKLPSQLKTIEDFAFTENQLTSIELPETLKSIGEWAFSDNQLTSLAIPSSVTSIGEYAFATNQLSNVTIPLSITSIAESVFLDNQLTTIEIPSSVTNIGRWAFGENQISSVEIPKNVMTVEDNAFTNNNLKRVKILSDTTILLEDIFNMNPSDLTIYGHDASTAQAYANQYNHLFELLTYQVIYDGNGSVQGNTPVDTNRYPRNAQATILDNIGALEKIGHTFDGWNSTTAGDGIDYVVNSIINVDESDLTLYAKWTVNSYSVTFHTNGGTVITPVTVIHEGRVSEPTPPTKTGHTFAGWYKDEDFNIPWDFATNKVMEDTTLYGKWTANSYTITFYTNGGTNIPSATAIYGEPMIEPVTPTKAGAAFLGWYKDEALNIPWDFATDVITGDTTLYAEWNVVQYTLDFDTNGGSSVPSQQVIYNTLATKPADPTKAGYTFAGWYKNGQFTTPWNFSTDVVTATLTLYAKWLGNSSSGGGGSSNPSPTPTPTPEPTMPEKPEQPVPEEPSEPESPEPTPQPETAIIFSDILQHHWAWQMIQEMAKQGIITGYPDGTFQPNAPIQRQHVALMMIRALELEPKKEALAFNDIPESHLYWGVINQVQQAGLFDGIDGNFQPNANMTRAQMAKVLVAAFNFTAIEQETFKDVPATHWAYDYIAILAANGIAIGDKGNFRPNDPVTRAEFAALLYRALHH